VMTGSGRLVEVQATAERVPFDEGQLGGLLVLARKAIAQLVEVQRDFVKLS